MQGSLRKYLAGLPAQDSKPHEQVSKGYQIAAITPSQEETPTDEPQSFDAKVEAVVRSMQRSRFSRRAGPAGPRSDKDKEAQTARDRAENRCYFCHNKGHQKAECEKLKAYLERKGSTSNQGNGKGQGRNQSSGSNASAPIATIYDIIQ